MSSEWYSFSLAHTRIAHISMIFHLLGYSGNSEPSVNLNSSIIHLLIHSVNQYGGPLHTKHHEGWFWTQGPRWTSSKDARVSDRSNLLHSGALDAHLGRLSTHFPMEPNPFSAQLISTRKEVVHFPLRCGQRLLLSKGQRPFGDLITTQPGLCQFLPGDYWTSFATSLGWHSSCPPCVLCHWRT